MYLSNISVQIHNRSATARLQSPISVRQSVENRKRETRRKIVLRALVLRETAKDQKAAEWLKNFLDKKLISARE